MFLSLNVFKQWALLINKKKEVGEVTYPDSIIQCCLLLKINYGLRYRQGTGFIRSLFMLLGKGHLPVPDYTTLCRRQKYLPAEIEERLNRGENLVIGIDSTGLKVYGEGEWKVRKHGWSKRRTWRKLHVCVDLNTQEVLCVKLTGNDEDDASVGEGMLAGSSHRLHGFKGDGAYDKTGFREVLGGDVQQVIPPQKNAVIRLPKKGKPVPGHLIQRNETVEYIQKHGIKKWKQERGYHQRSLNEVVMFRYKTIFGGELDARLIENQTTEIKLKCLLLNKFTGMGMPNSYKIV
jgi:hypothetical protein